MELDPLSRDLWVDCYILGSPGIVVLQIRVLGFHPAVALPSEHDFGHRDSKRAHSLER
jgi:hypothetical protein